MRDLYVTLIYTAFLVLGTAAPFVFGLGYIWVDSFNPQYVASTVLGSFPVSQVMGAAAVLGYVLLDRRSPPQLTLFLVLTVAFAGWVTATTFWAEAEDFAWDKWNWAFKTIAFSAFIPFLFRSRIQIEALISVWIFGLLVQILPVGLKTAVSGGGYGQELGLVGNNNGFTEGSTLASVSLMIVPLLFFIRAHGLLIPRFPLRSLVFIALAGVSLVAAVGTFERTGLIGLFVLAGASWLRARRKILFLAAIMIGALVVGSVSSDRWTERMQTINAPTQDSSALTRLLVWDWTWRYVQIHPLGGGFNSYIKSVIVFPGTDDEPEPLIVHGRAFHSIYFEILGEQGFPGIGLFLALVATTMLSLQGTRRRTRKLPELVWCSDLAGALQVSLIVLLACGAFIGIGFQPMFYMLFATSMCLQQHLRRALAPPLPAPRWRQMPAPAMAKTTLSGSNFIQRLDR